MPLYEHVYLARQDITTQQVEAINNTIEELIKKDGGSIDKVEYWGLRQLAYKIKKNRFSMVFRGFSLVFLCFSLDFSQG